MNSAMLINILSRFTMLTSVDIDVLYMTVPIIIPRFMLVTCSGRILKTVVSPIVPASTFAVTLMQ